MLNLFSILNTENSKIEFMKGLIRIAKIGGVEKEEIVYFNNLATSIGISKQEVGNLNNLFDSDDHISINFETHEQKIAFLIESIQLCYIDGQYSKEEQDEMQNIAKEIGISENALAKINEWVNEGVKWSNKVNDLLALK